MSKARRYFHLSRIVATIILLVIYSYSIFDISYTNIRKSVMMHQETAGHHSGAQILYIVRTYPTNHGSKLKNQAQTWLSLIPPEMILISTMPENKTSLPHELANVTTLRNENCPDNHGLGLCCQNVNALLSSLAIPHWEWVWLIDDDMFVAPHKLSIALKKENSSDAIGILGCVAAGYQGFCRGGGVGIKHSMVEKLFYDREEVKKEYLENCEKTQFCDITSKL